MTKCPTLLGKPRLKEDEVQKKHKDIACSLQFVYEKTLFHILSYLNDQYPGYENLCLSGGCAQNSLLTERLQQKVNLKMFGFNQQLVMLEELLELR